MANQNDDLILNISARLDELINDIDLAKTKFKGLKGGVNDVDKTLKKGMEGWQAGFAKFGLAVQGVQQGFRLLDRTVGGAVRTMATFQTSMTEVNTLLNLTQEQFKGLNKQVVDLSKKIPQTADQLSKGLYQVVSAGVDAGDAMAFLETASKGAVAGLTDTKVSVDAITSVINAYGKEAEEAESVSDIFFQTVKLGKTTFAEMGESMGQIIPIASAFNVPFEQIAGAYATMTKSGVKTRQVSTALAATINEMVKPSSKAEKAIRGLGYGSGQLALEEKGLQEIIIELTESGVNMTEIFGQEALKAVLALGKSSILTRDDLDAMNTSAGATNTAFGLMNETLENQKILLDNEVQALYLEFSDVLIPGWTDALKALRSAFDDSGAASKVLAGAGTDEVSQLEARREALKLLSDEYRGTSKSALDQFNFLNKNKEVLNQLGVGIRNVAGLQEGMNEVWVESAELIPKITKAKAEQAEADKAKADQDAKDAKAAEERALQGEETAIRTHETEVGLIELMDVVKEKSVTREQAQLMLLQGGFKDYLKQRALDWINAKQLEMLGTLGTIWAEGGATLGTSLLVSLPMYATGLLALEGARRLVTMFAEGGRVDSPTLAMLGEAGTEFVAPEAKFEQYSRDTLTPMIQAQVENKLARDGGNGALSGGLAEIKDAVVDLKQTVSSPYTVLTGSQLQVLNGRLARGQLVN